MNIFLKLLFPIGVVAFTGCVSVGPDYAKPTNAIPTTAYKLFFPVVRLTGSGGFVSGDIESLFNWESRIWSVGPAISLPIFAG